MCEDASYRYEKLEANRRQMNSSKQIKLGAILSYFAIAFNIISGLLYTPWMEDTIGQSQYGLYALANSLITLFMVDFGLSAATSRYLSKYNAEGNREAAERFLGAIYKLYMIIDGVIFTVLLILFFFLDQIYVKLTPTELEQFKVVYVISALFSVINFPFVTFNGILTAYEKFVPLKVLDFLYRAFNIGFTVIALLMGYGLYALVTVHAAVGLLILVIKFIVIRKTIPVRVKFKSSQKGIYKEIFSFSLWVTVSSLALRLVFNITPSILSIVAGGTAAAAVFAVVTTLEGYTYMVTNAINGMFMPRISRYMAKENGEEDLNALFVSVGKFQFVLNGLIVAGLCVVGKSFIGLWMGEEYQGAYYGVLLVVMPGLFYNAMQIANTTMIVQKKVKTTAWVNVATGLINVALSFPLSYLLGVTGACISICVAYCVRAVALIIIYHKKLPLDIPGFLKNCYMRMCIPVLLTIAAGLAMNYFVADGGWLMFLIKAGITAMLYLVLTFLLGYSKAERKDVLRYIKR